MGRKSSLTDKQWHEIGKRLLTGTESARAIAREFGTSEASIRRKFPAQRRDVKDVANQLFAAETALKALPISSQIDALSYLDGLKAISQHGVSAAHYGMMTAHRLSAIAHAQTSQIDETATLEENGNAVRSVVVMTEAANKAANIGLNLLAANKDAMKEKDIPPEREREIDLFVEQMKRFLSDRSSPVRVIEHNED